ncbi:CHAD domain-containing protein [Nocardia arthritidis]|nr:CHAD domain-containing protein [Nocardia arthritidis]
MAATAGSAIVKALRDDVDRLLAAEPDVRADAPDSVHQMRVATRRLRSVLRSYKSLFDPAPVADVQEELKWLAGVLGVARDAEVRADRFETLLAENTSDGAAESAPIEHVTADLVDAERARYASAHDRIRDVLHSGRYHKLRGELSAWRTAPPLRPDRAGLPADEAFERVLRKDLKRLRRLVYAEPSAPAAERIELLHDIRKGAKRLRYSCDAAAHVLGRDAEKLGSQAKQLQGVLGDHRDAVESRDSLLSTAERTDVRDEASIYEILAAAEDLAAGQALARYPSAAAFVSGR